MGWRFAYFKILPTTQAWMTTKRFFPPTIPHLRTYPFSLAGRPIIFLYLKEKRKEQKNLLVSLISHNFNSKKKSNHIKFICNPIFIHLLHDPRCPHSCYFILFLIFFPFFELFMLSLGLKIGFFSSTPQKSQYEILNLLPKI